MKAGPVSLDRALHLIVLVFAAVCVVVVQHAVMESRTRSDSRERELCEFLTISNPRPGVSVRDAVQRRDWLEAFPGFRVEVVETSAGSAARLVRKEGLER